MTTLANINGANITRLSFQQMHSNACQCVLMQPPVDDSETNRYITTVENLVVSTDIPIFKKGTEVFTIMEVTFPDDEKSPSDNPWERFDGYDNDEDLSANRKCVVGPVYSFSDFVHQVQEFCTRYNRDITLTGNRGRIYVDARLAARKQFGLQGNLQFWSRHILDFTNEFGRLFDNMLGEENYYHQYLHNNTYGHAKGPLHNDQIWLQDVTEYMFLDEDGEATMWDFGSYATLAMPCKLDMFENRVGLQVDSVLPLPFEMFCVNANKQDRNKGKSRYAFLTLDFPEGALSHITRFGSFTSDEIDISQQVRTGLFQLMPDANNSVSKKLLAGTLQTQRYELMLVRKVANKDGTVTLKTEPVEFTNGDFWSMDVIFTKQV